MPLPPSASRATGPTQGRETAVMVDRGDHRIGDDERQQAIDMLRVHTGAGRLTLDEFSDLAGKVYAAQTYRELEAVAEDLPPGLVPEPGAPAGAAPLAGPFAAVPGPSDAVRQTGAGSPALPRAPGHPDAPVDGRPARRRFVAVMSTSKARGRWRPAPTVSAVAFWGGVKIDLRKADVATPVVDITAWAIMGGVTVVVDPGTRVELDGMVLMGGSHDSTPADDPPPAGSPLVRVHARGLWGGVHVRTGHADTVARVEAARRAAAERRTVPRPGATDERGAPPGAGATDDRRHERPPNPLELPQHVLDDVAAALPRVLTPPSGVPVRRRRRSGHARGRSDPWPDDRPQDAPGATPPPSTRTGQDGDGPGAGHEGAGAPDGVPADRLSADRSGSNGASPHTVIGGPTPSPSGTLTMMVTDIAASTALAERLGDRRWMDVLGAHNALVREQVAGHGGTEVKAQGDGFLVVFPSARRAILAAIEVQRALARYRDDHPDTPVAVRIGLHTGEIVDVDGDVFGQNVVVAARLAAEADPDEIVVSALTRDLTVSGGDLTFGPAAEVELKGLSTPWRVHRVPWSVESA
ncbi:MAG TPA: DUF1707 domain-containing protein [Acidimicrobiales bacterium]|nr:DUF1707 domain-containing protein [Acidimicrobiales bacterium]